jgi:hypothetical protein
MDKTFTQQNIPWLEIPLNSFNMSFKKKFIEIRQAHAKQKLRKVVEPIN